MSTIPLAKGFKPEKLKYPVLLSEKLDGVPIAVTITVSGDGTPVLPATIKTRQGEDRPAARSIVNEYVSMNLHFFQGFPGTHTLVGELYQTGDPHAPFKDTSGIARRQVDAGNALSLGIFDYFWDKGDIRYYGRMTYWDTKSKDTDYVHGITAMTVYDEEELMEYFETFMRDNPRAEGMVARSCDDTFNPGKRSWGYQKMLHEPTIDLRIVGFEEAVDKYGAKKGMVGRLVAQYGDQKIAVGPGKLTHKEREELWWLYRRKISEQNGVYTDLGIAQIKYKKDDSYDALRQPTFQHWRDDKSTPDA